MEFKSWRDVQKWATKNGLKHLADRMELNNDCWMSSGEFGRSQKFICDSIRFANEADRLEVGKELNRMFSKNYGLYE